MNTENVKAFIDKKILKSMVDGVSIASIKNELAIKSKNMTNSLFLDNEKSNLSPYTIDQFLSMTGEQLDEVIGNSRLKYLSFYISHSKKRIFDLDWLVSKKGEFKKFSNSQIFNLIKLKEKLSNQVPV